jgi:predicted acetyltransferase
MHLERASIDPPPGLEEFLRELGGGDRGFSGTSFGRGETDLAGYLRSCVDGEDPTKIGPGFVPQTVYWMIDDEHQLVGMVRVRHQLNANLLQHGGHVGYYVRPAARGKGHAKRAVRMALDRLREINVTRALITVDPSNEPSIRVVLANGGRTVTQGRHPETGQVVNRYWIDLNEGRSPTGRSILCD